MAFNRPILQQATNIGLPYAIAPRQQPNLEFSVADISRPPSASAFRPSRPNSRMSALAGNGVHSMTASMMLGAQACTAEGSYGSGRFGQLLQALASEHEREVAGLMEELDSVRAHPVARRPSQERAAPARMSSTNLEIPEGVARSHAVSEAVRQLREEREASEREAADEESLILTPVLPVSSMVPDPLSVVVGESEENGSSTYPSIANTASINDRATVNEVRNRQILDESPSFGSSDSDSDLDKELCERPDKPDRTFGRKTSLIINGADFNNVLEQRDFALWPVWEGLPVRQSDMHEVGRDNAANNTMYDDFRGMTQFNLTDQQSRSIVVRCLQRCVMHPRCRLRILWNLLALLIIGVDIIMVPFEVFEPPESALTSTLAYTTQLFWNVDIISNFFVGYWEQAAVVMNLNKIATNYANTWLSVDLFLVLTDWIVLSLTVHGTDSGAAGLGRIGKSVRYFRFLRSFRLLRLIKMRELMERMQWSFMSDVVSVRFGIGKMVLVILIINHLLACAWYGIGRLKFEGRSWLDDFDEASLLYRYTTSFHWSVSQFGVGTAELDAFNTVERSFSILVGLFALMTFSSIVSSITNLMSHLNSLNDRNRHFSVFRRYCAEHGVSKELLHRMSQYIEYALEHQKRSVAAVDVRLLNLLSEPLYEELQKEIYEPHFLAHPLFIKLCKFYSVAMRSVCRSAVSTLFLAPRDTLFRPRQVAARMFFICGGNLHYERDGSMETLESPSFFSEAVLWTPWLFLGLMEAITPTELVALASHEFSEAIKMHPATFTRVKRYATQFVEALKAATKEERTDLYVDGQMELSVRMVPSNYLQGSIEEVKQSLFTRITGKVFKKGSAGTPVSPCAAVGPSPSPIAVPDEPAPRLPTSDLDVECFSDSFSNTSSKENGIKS